MVYLLNAPIITEYGTYTFRRIDVDEAKEIIASGFVSVIGHQGTADLLSAIFGITIPMNRVAIRMEKGDKVVVFRVLTRLEEGKILDAEAIKAIPYELGFLERLE